MFPSYRSLPHLECSRSLNLPSARVADHNAAGEARTQWAERSTLYLRNATADAIQDLPDAGGPKCQTAGPDGGPPGQLVRKWVGKQVPYAPGSYEQLATVLRSVGRPGAAAEMVACARSRSLPHLQIDLT